MRAYFEQVQYKKVGDEEALVVEGNPKVLHPRTKEALRAHPLGEASRRVIRRGIGGARFRNG